MVAENPSAANLYDYTMGEGIEASSYIEVLSTQDPTGGASDLDESEVYQGQQDLANAKAWYDNLFARLDESYANRESTDQVVFRQQWDGSIVAEPRTVYDTMDIVQVEPCEYYTLSSEKWYWVITDDEYGYQWVTWFTLNPHEDGYLYAFYNTINGDPTVTWGGDVVCTYRVDKPEYGRKMTRLDEHAMINMNDYTIMLQSYFYNSNGVLVAQYFTIPVDSANCVEGFNRDTTQEEIDNYTINTIIPSLS